MNISISEEMHSAILDRMRTRYHSSVSEYIRALVRNDLREHNRPGLPKEISRPRTANECMRDGVPAGYELIELEDGTYMVPSSEISGREQRKP